MLVIISFPERSERESNQINELFKHGLQTFHFRKPDLNKDAYEDILKAVSPENKRKIVLHQYHELVGKYNIKGLHLKEESRKNVKLEDLKNLRKEMISKNLTLSSSFHSFEEIIKHDGIFDYVFFSPVFESISKPGYKSKVELGIMGNYFKNSLKTKIIALGGIQADNITKVKDYGFDGVAIMGAIWQNPDQAITQFEAIQNQYSEHFINSSIY